MNPELKHVGKHILSLALGALAHANRHACYYCRENRWWPAMSVLQAGHAAELMIKARIALEHPLLIFEQVPRSTQTNSTHLDFAALFELGKTLQYFDLPERLWAVTGVRIANIELYKSFGRLRNALQHFSSGDGQDFSGEALRFIFGVIDPLLNECWDGFAVDYNEDCLDEYDGILSALTHREIVFSVSSSVLNRVEAYLEDTSANYQKEMRNRIELARGSAGKKYSAKLRIEGWQEPGPWYGSDSRFSMEESELVSCADEPIEIPSQRELEIAYTSEDDGGAT